MTNKVAQKVALGTANPNLPGSMSSKLTPVYLGPSAIVDMVGPNTARLDFEEQNGPHDVVRIPGPWRRS